MAQHLHHVPVQQLPKFLHACIDQMCGREEVRHEDWVPEVFADAEAVEQAIDWCQQVLIQWIDTRDKNDVSPLLVMQLQANPFSSLSLCPRLLGSCSQTTSYQMPQVTTSGDGEKDKVLYECLESRRPELKTALITSIVRKSGHAFLVDSDWKVSYVLSSSALSRIEEPIALFTFTLSTHETFSVELNVSQMDVLLKVLSEARNCFAD